MALTDKLTAIGDAIRDKTGSTDLLTLDAMPTAISGITTGGGDLYDYIPEEAFYVTGDCSYKFAYNTWDWFVERYGDKVTTDNISTMTRMFDGSEVEEISFSINGVTSGNNCTAQYMFYNCKQLKKLPDITGRLSGINSIIYNCCRLKEIPENWLEGVNWERLHTYATANMASIFSNCNSLRKIPESLLSNLWGIQTNYLYSPYNNMIYNCSAMDELLNLEVLDVTITSNNLFSKTFEGTYRLKGMTFKTDDGNVKVANWKGQILDFSVCVGYVNNNYEEWITGYNSGITSDKKVTDDATYQALKNDPDWYTLKIEYSRYNHDSAVATINSLPDTSAYLATAGGTNTIKFKGVAGSATDGGAINTLTEEEIAVAIAKGWTVTFA